MLILALVALLLAGCSRAAPPPGLTYVALGASDTVGVGASDPTTEGWVPQFYHRLPPNTKLVNLGVSGFKLNEALTQTLPIAQDAHPDIVTIWLAVNDFNARVDLVQYERDLDKLLAGVQASGAQRILIANIPALEGVPVYASQGIPPQRLAGQVSQWNDVIARQAAKHGAILVDVHSQWSELASHPEYVSIDGFHPSAAGYSRLADLFYNTLQANGGLPSRTQ
ncbi:MAG: GDSL-type esterase/lipase family protein [Anaerolineae bacterium]